MEEHFKLTKPDGSTESMPTSMELHYGNTCNLKCKMCGQNYSNQIGKELLEIGKSDKDFLSWAPTKDSRWDLDLLQNKTDPGSGVC